MLDIALSGEAVACDLPRSSGLLEDKQLMIGLVGRLAGRVDLLFPGRCRAGKRPRIRNDANFYDGEGHRERDTSEDHVVRLSNGVSSDEGREFLWHENAVRCVDRHDGIRV